MPRVLFTAALSCTMALGAFSAQVQAAPNSPFQAPSSTSVGSKTGLAPQPATATAARDRVAHAEDEAKLDLSLRAPHTAPRTQEAATTKLKAQAAPSAQAAAACNTSDFTSRTGSALVTAVKGATVDCVNTLFTLKGTDANKAFREAQMVTIANALRDVAVNYPGNNTTSTAQLVLYLRAGYYVQFYDSASVGSYGTALKNAIRPALDAFYASARSGDVSDANGDILSEAVTLIDSSGENARYLYVVKRLLNNYGTSYDAYWGMKAAVNNVYTVLWRGHQMPEFVTAVQNDTSVLTQMDAFATKWNSKLGGDTGYLVSNAGRELGRFLKDTPIQPTARPLVKHLLDQSQMTGRTAALWAGLAEMASEYDAANCSYYGTCDLSNRVKAAILTVRYTCSPSLKIAAQQMSSTELTATCTSLANQDAFFHNVVRDNGPVANDNNTNLEVSVFDSSSDYQTYAGIIYGIDTDNGGMYLEGKPEVAGNQARFIAYEAEWVRPTFEIWNLNHEYTHYLDGRYDTYGDFDAGQVKPIIWWVEGFAEYVSYHYRGVTYSDAITEAGTHRYALSTLFDTTYDNTDQTRTYNWGYLATRYMLQSHRSDVDAVLAKYRSGDYAGAYTYLKSTIGTRYDTDFYNWLTACNAGNCGSLSNPPVPQCTNADSRQLDKNCGRSNLSAGAGGISYLYVYLPAGTPKLTITSSGGTGNADLYYNYNNWATNTSYYTRSTGPTNAETLTITNPQAGWNYISLYGQQAFSGATVTTSF
ncbi:M9 family metallopeptidase [Kitasatospora sp. NPDC096147]|uniref:M9 family metallopeptidase n=1 Tax=Kitasatospora sp. NPDC096147 TaxID=3364093 RepID=UPI003816F0BB